MAVLREGPGPFRGQNEGLERALWNRGCGIHAPVFTVSTHQAEMPEWHPSRVRPLHGGMRTPILSLQLQGTATTHSPPLQTPADHLGDILSWTSYFTTLHAMKTFRREYTYF